MVIRITATLEAIANTLKPYFMNIIISIFLIMIILLSINFISIIPIPIAISIIIIAIVINWLIFHHKSFLNY